MNTKETNHKNVGSFGGGRVNSEENVGSNIQSSVKIGIGIMNAPMIHANQTTQKNATSSMMVNAITINVDFYTHQE